MGRAKNETGQHRAAFELWYALGADRSLSEVARRSKVHVSSVANWSAAFGWEKRLLAREKLVADLLAQKAVEDEVRSKSDALKICRAIQIKFVEHLRSGKAIIEAGDFEKAVKLELLLRGKATDRSEVIAGPMIEKLIDLILIVLEREIQDPLLRDRIAAGLQEAAANVGNA